VDTQAKKLLARWRSLEGGEGIRVARSTSRVLSVVGFVLCLFVVFGVVYRWHSAVIALAAAAMGWVVAERNALGSRIAQWPTFQKYLNWERVREDSERDA
jgi:hypothetical protein